MREIRTDNWASVTDQQWAWKNFRPEEMACRMSGALVISCELMDILQFLRDTLGFALPVTSGFRSVEHDLAVGGKGAHTTGMACDIGLYGEKAKKFVVLAAPLVTGLGVNLAGPHFKRFIHIDILPVDDKTMPRPAFWSYK